MLAFVQFALSPLGRAIAIGLLISGLVAGLAFQTHRADSLSGQVAAAHRCDADVSSAVVKGDAPVKALGSRLNQIQ